MGPGTPGARQPFEEPYTSTEGWAKYNRYYWQDHYRDFLEFFFSQCFTEAHSTKQIEDAVGWGLETSAAVLLAENDAPWADEATLLRLVRRQPLPGAGHPRHKDAISPLRRAERLAKATGGALTVLEGAGHIPMARDPVKVNLLIREFAGSLAPMERP